MERYEKYRDSGVEYIGEIPTDWNVVKMKFLSSGVKTGSTPPSEEIEYFEPGEINWYGPGDFSTTLLDEAKRKISKKAIEDGKCKLFGPESILLIGIGATVGKFGKAITYFSANQQINVITFINEKFLPDFGLYFLSTIKEIIYTTASSATLPIFNQSQTKELILPVPLTFSEQSAIANYLDKKTSELDTLITKKEKLIELLKEERTAIINQAVTKGLDLNVEMKDSGVEWLGEIPAHWDLKRIKHVNSKVGSGVTPKGGAEVYQESGIPLLRSQNVYFDGFRLDDVAFISEEIHDSMSNSKVLANDVLINITGGSIGRCYYVSNEFDDANVNQHVCIIRPNDKIVTLYLYNLLRSDIGQMQVDLCQTGGNREALNFEQLKNFVIPLPDVQEQKQIVEFVKKEQGKIDTIISKASQEITLLKEYKTALISEVVTGKVKVI